MANQQPDVDPQSAPFSAGLEGVPTAAGDSEETIDPEDIYGPASFPASDPPSTWWGGRSAGDGD